MEEFNEKIFEVVGLDKLFFNSFQVTKMSMEEFGVYSLLCFHGPLSGKNISALFSREPKGKVYCVLEILRKRGFIEQSCNGLKNQNSTAGGE